MGHGTVNYSRRDKRLIGADRDVAEKAENSIAKLDCRMPKHHPSVVDFLHRVSNDFSKQVFETFFFLLSTMTTTMAFISTEWLHPRDGTTRKITGEGEGEKKKVWNISANAIRSLLK